MERIRSRQIRSAPEVIRVTIEFATQKIAFLADSCPWNRKKVPTPENSAILNSVLALSDGYESRAVEQFMGRLIAMARS